jgi:hypothetical protein
MFAIAYEIYQVRTRVLFIPLRYELLGAAEATHRDTKTLMYECLVNCPLYAR